eukprot:2342099-Ditylum_brightwellii.AAC.1
MPQSAPWKPGTSSSTFASEVRPLGPDFLDECSNLSPQNPLMISYVDVNDTNIGNSASQQLPPLLQISRLQ